MILEAFKILITAIVILFAGIGAIVGYESYQDYIKKAGVSASSNAGYSQPASDASGTAVMPNVVSSLAPESVYQGAPFLAKEDEYRKAVLEQFQKGQPVYFIGEVVQVIKPNVVKVSTEMQFYGTNILHMEFLGFSGQEVLVRFPDRPPYIQGDSVSINGQYLGVVNDMPVIDADYYALSDNSTHFPNSEGKGFAAR